MDDVGRNEQHVARIERVARVSDDIIRVAGNEKIEFIKFMIVRRDLVVVLMHRMLSLEIALLHEVLVQPVIVLI